MAVRTGSINNCGVSGSSIVFVNRTLNEKSPPAGTGAGGSRTIRPSSLPLRHVSGALSSPVIWPVCQPSGSCRASSNSGAFRLSTVASQTRDAVVSTDGQCGIQFGEEFAIPGFHGHGKVVVLQPEVEDLTGRVL